MKILIANTTKHGATQWAVHVDETKTVPNPAYDPRETLPDPKFVIMKEWAGLTREDGEKDAAFAARVAQHIEMQKRELQAEADALVNPVGIESMDIAGQSMERLV